LTSYALFVILAALCGCGGTTSATTSAQVVASVKAPAHVALHIDTGSYSLAAPSTTVSGTVTRGASVRVNGRPIPVRSGHWSLTLALHLGRNRIGVAAVMQGRAPAAKSISITRERSAAELEAQAEAQKRHAEAEEQKAIEERTRAEERKATAEETPACTNGTYVNSAGNTVCSPEHAPSAPAGATAECEDGTYSFSESRSGTCSHHGGVRRWM
jgi:hypothetical protein